MGAEEVREGFTEEDEGRRRSQLVAQNPWTMDNLGLKDGTLCHCTVQSFLPCYMNDSALDRYTRLGQRCKHISIPYGWRWQFVYVTVVLWCTEQAWVQSSSVEMPDAAEEGDDIARGNHHRHWSIESKETP